VSRRPRWNERSYSILCAECGLHVRRVGVFCSERCKLNHDYGYATDPTPDEILARAEAIREARPETTNIPLLKRRIVPYTIPDCGYDRKRKGFQGQ